MFLLPRYVVPRPLEVHLSLFSPTNNSLTCHSTPIYIFHAWNHLCRIKLLNYFNIVSPHFNPSIHVIAKFPNDFCELLQAVRCARITTYPISRIIIDSMNIGSNNRQPCIASIASRIANPTPSLFDEKQNKSAAHNNLSTSCRKPKKCALSVNFNSDARFLSSYSLSPIPNRLWWI